MRCLILDWHFRIFLAVMLLANCVLAQADTISSGLEKYNSGDLDGALTDFNMAVKLVPTNSVAYYNRGFLKRKLGDLNGAILDYSEAIKLNTNFADAYRSRGGAETILNDLDGAFADFTAALRLEPYDELTQNLLNSVRSQIELKQAQLAEPVPVKPPLLYTDKIINITNTAGTVYHDVRIVGNVPDGIYFEYANTNNAGGGKIMFVNLSDEWKTRFKYSPEAASQFQQYVADKNEQYRQAQKEVSQQDSVSDAYYNQGVAKFNNGDVDGGIADLNASTTILKKQADAYNNRSFTEYGNGDNESGLADTYKYTATLQKMCDEVSAETAAIKMANQLGK